MNQERGLLVIIDIKSNHDWMAADLAIELEELAKACEVEVVDQVICPVDRISPALLIGKGKAQEIADLCQLHRINTVIFSHDLKGSQQRNLEEVIEVKTIDRTQLILDIFARRASSVEGKMQVELAQLEYMLPRLVGSGIALSRLGGGIGTLGPGETKLEVDRRRIGQRVAKLKRELKEVEGSRALKRKRRKDQGLPIVSLVGYTNAGKSTLLNKLTDAGQATKEGLFTTLDSLSRQYVLPNHQKVILSDTVGFMHALPHHVIEAFHATLEEVAQADLLLHVIDVSHPNIQQFYETVNTVLAEIHAGEKPVITVLNKIDRIKNRDDIEQVKKLFKNPVAISAETGENLSTLTDAVMHELSSLIINVDLMLPINRMDLINLAHQEGQVFSVKYYNDTINLRAALPAQLAGLIMKNRAPDSEVS